MARASAWLLGIIMAASPASSWGEGRVWLQRRMVYGTATSGGSAPLALPDVTTPAAATSVAFERLLQVAPGERAFASWSPSSRLLVVVAGDGAERIRIAGATGAFRFSPEGDSLAFAGERGLELLDLSTGQRTLVAPLHAIADVAWTSAGMVVVHGPPQRRDLTLLAPSGERRRLATSGSVQGFAAAGLHVVWISEGNLFHRDVSATGGRAARIELVSKAVDLLSLSRDGTKVLFAARGRVYLREAGGAARIIAQAADVHSLSFAADSESLLWASARGGELVRGDKRQSLPRKVSSARFRSRGDGVVLTDNDGVHLWAPDTGALERLSALPDEEGHEIAGEVMGNVTLVFYLHTPPEVKLQMAPDLRRP